MNKKAQAQFIPAIIIILVLLYFLNQQLTPQIAEINIENGICSNLNLNIGKGTTVRWTNRGTQQVELDLTSITDQAVSVNLPTGATYSLKFTATGSYAYTCAGRPAQINVK